MFRRDATAKRLTNGINGGVAQLGEHLLCKQGVMGSSPFSSTGLKVDLLKKNRKLAVADLIQIDKTYFPHD